MITLETERLILRDWASEDIAPMGKMISDPEVQRYFPRVHEPDEALNVIGILANYKHSDLGLRPVILKETGEFVGMCGLANVYFEAHFTPAIDIGWRLRREFWGRGYVTEAAARWLDFGFFERNYSEVVSMAVHNNARSVAVMERLGMTNDPEDNFDHPVIDEGNPLRPHVLYRMTGSRWQDLKRTNLPV